MLEKVKEALTHAQAAYKEFQKAEDILSGGPSSYYFQRIEEYVEGLFSFCPFRIGDKVVLVKKPQIDEKSGWWGCRHFLVEGAIGTVREVDYYPWHFTACVEFDNESWIDSWNKKEIHPVENKHVFHFSEDYLLVIKP